MHLRSTPGSSPPRYGLVASAGLFAVLVAVVLASTAAVPNAASTYYAAPDGLASNDGTLGRPLDLVTALSSQGPVRPGDTVWLRGGVYRRSASPDSHGDLFTFVSTLTGTADAPITVRQFPGERATLDGNLSPSAPVLGIFGSYTNYWGFEVTNSNTNRSVSRGDGIDTYGHHNKLINLVIHDSGSGIALGSDAVDAEVYGNIIYYNGIVRPEGGQGHGIFGQNKTGIRHITDNILFGQFGSGIRAYASEEGFLNNFQLEGNIASNNGVAGSEYSVLLGGNRVAERPVLTANYAYDNPGAGINIGYAAGCDGVVMKDNYFSVLRAGYAMQLVNCSGGLQGNVLIGATRGITGTTIVTQAELATRYPGNEFTEAPTATRTFVRPNRYAPGRAHVIVYNWEHTKEVEVELPAGVLAPGAAYELRDVRNLPAGPVASGIYSGRAIRVPLDGLKPAPVIGWDQTPPHTAPEFAVFLLTSRSGTPSTTSSLVARLRGLVGL